MKTAELTVGTVYSFKERPSAASTCAVKVLETGLWTEADEWYDDESDNSRQQRRVLRRAEKGANQ